MGNIVVYCTWNKTQENREMHLNMKLGSLILLIEPSARFDEHRVKVWDVWADQVFPASTQTEAEAIEILRDFLRPGELGPKFRQLFPHIERIDERTSLRAWIRQLSRKTAEQLLKAAREAEGEKDERTR